MNVFSKNKNISIEQRNSIITRIIQFVLGCLIIAIAYNVFIVPNKLVPGGVGGIAIIINNIFHFNNSTTILVINIFLLILSYILLGKIKTRATIVGAILFPLLVRLTEHINVWLQIDTSQVLLSSIVGGILFGFGAGLVFKSGATTGGTDIVNQILSKYLKISIGKSMLISDGLIVLLSAVFFGINNMMYSVLVLYIISLISDRVLLGISDSKLFMIITDKEKEVKEYILKELKHGTTIYKATGGFNPEKKEVIMVALPTKDYYKLKEGISIIDKNAFYIITDTYEVFGGE